jgi:LPPG:FO 2-phospho-L-lactate transferase
VVILAGGTGGAKLARGMLDVVEPSQLTVIANTGDDIEIYGTVVSPDPDLVTFWLADLIDDRGWGLRDDTFHVMDGLRQLGRDVWFNLGDRDLAWCLERGRLVADGESPTTAHARLTQALGLKAHVVPMSDDPVRTWVHTDGDWRSFQEFMIRLGGRGPVDDVAFRGAADAAASPAALAAIAAADAIIIGPSNPVASIGPILAVDQLRDALAAAPARVVAVSPIVGQEVLKGPTAAFLQHAGVPATVAGVIDHYGLMIDGIVADERPGDIALLQTDVLMSDADGRRRVAAETLDFALALSAR